MKHLLLTMGILLFSTVSFADYCDSACEPAQAACDPVIAESACEPVAAAPAVVVVEKQGIIQRVRSRFQKSVSVQKEVRGFRAIRSKQIQIN